MSSHAYAPSPDLSELMRLFKMDVSDDLTPPEGTRAVESPEAWIPQPPPAPLHTLGDTATTTSNVTHSQKHQAASTTSLVAAASYREFAQSRARQDEYRTGGWNSSTQVLKDTAKPLKHQILCRNFVPPAPLVVERKTANQLLQRLSKATISSGMKGPTTVANSTAAQPAIDVNNSAKRVEIDRKRLHLQRRHEKDQTHALGSGAVPTNVRGGREAIQLLLHYRSEVEKRLRSDPMYALQQDMSP